MFEVAWNTQWPASCPQHFPSDAITRFGVTTNAGNAFNGKAVTTMYNRPWAMTLGAWPCLFANGTAVNGGLPQLGNLSRHLEQVRIDAAKLPADFAGYAVIDWEEWTPWLDPNAPLYYNRSLALAGGDVAAATAAWNASSLEFMVRTLEVAREVRPRGKWGYFGVIGCTFDVATEACRVGGAQRARGITLCVCARCVKVVPMIFEPSGAMAPETHAHLRKLDKIGRDNPAARDGTR